MLDLVRLRVKSNMVFIFVFEDGFWFNSRGRRRLLGRRRADNVRVASRACIVVVGAFVAGLVVCGVSVARVVEHVVVAVMDFGVWLVTLVGPSRRQRWSRVGGAGGAALGALTGEV